MDNVFDRVQDVELKDFLEIVYGPVQNHKTKSGEIGIFVQAGLEGRQHFLGRYYGVVLSLKERPEKTKFYVYEIQETFEVRKC